MHKRVVIPNLRIGEQLIAAGVLSSENLEKGLVLQREQGGFLLDVLLSGKLIEERDALRFLAEAASARYITAEKLAQAALTPEILDRIPVRHAERLEVLPLAFDATGNTLTLALAEVDTEVLDQVRLSTGASRIIPVIATRAAIRAGIRRFFYSDTYAFAFLHEERRKAVVHASPPGKVLAREASFVGVAPRPDSAKDIRKLKRELQFFRIASELHRHLAQEREEAAILHKVLAFAFDNLPADEGVLLTKEPGTKAMVPRAVRSRVGDQSEVVISETLLQEVLGTRQGVLTGDALVDERFKNAESVVSSGMRSAMGVPIVVEGDVRGVLILDTRGSVDVFTEQDLQGLMAIAAQAAISLENARLSKRIAAETATRAHLARFLSPALVEQAARGVLSLSVGGDAQEATLLFADIRGFTAISERHSPKDVVSMLNEHFEDLVDVVFAHGGVLDKFIGDALMAIWGVPLRRPDDPSRALRAALEMTQRVQAANARRFAAGKVALEVGIGVNTGPVVFGAIGSTRRLEFTAIGDAVNIASRLCDQAGPGQVVAAEASVRAAGDGFLTEALTMGRLRGVSRKIQAFAVTGQRAAAGVPPECERASGTGEEHR